MDRLNSNSTVNSGSSKTGMLDQMQTIDHVHTRDALMDSASPASEPQPRTYKTYKRRFWGLAQLVLLNIIISWDWLTFAAVSTTSAQYFRTDESTINWLSTAFLFAFVPVAPLVLWTLNKLGPKSSILAASALVLLGNWIRYAGTAATNGHFGVVMFGQILIGFSQPFVLAAPTRYSNLWFSDKGRVTATAVASLANPLGAALGQLIGPAWVNGPPDIPNMVLYTSIISTAVTLPAVFIPKAPPTPPSAMAAAEKLDLSLSFHALRKNGSFYLIAIPFAVYVGFFNAFSSLINQIFQPYGFSETDAGLAGGILIIVGLVAAAIISPIIDKVRSHVLFIKVFVPLIAVCYLIMIWMPGTRSVTGPYVVCAVLGAASFSLLPCALEYLVIVTNPISPEITSVVCWTSGQLLGAIFILVMDALRGVWSGTNEPAGTMISALIFEAVIAWVAVPLPAWLGTGRFRKDGVRGWNEV